MVYEVLVGLGVRDTLLFADTALHINPANMLPGNPAHVVLRFAPAPQQPEWSAPGIRNLPPARQHPPLRFSDWWGMPLTRDTAEPPHIWSRKDLVMQIRDKDGGSHDPHRPPKGLRALEGDGRLGWSRVDPLTGQTTMMNGPLLPSVRQIAWEVEATLEPLVKRRS